jgi:hypothetical protein
MDLIELNKIDPRNFKRHPWEKARLKVISNLISKTLANKDSQYIHLIDIGSGDMYLIKELQKRFKFKSWTAIDNAFTSELTSNLAKCDSIIICNDIKKIEAKENEHYLILLLDVLEHIEHDFLFLKNLERKYSKANFNLLVTVPSFQNLYSYHDRALLHFRRYNNTELYQIARNASLDVKDSGYFFFTLLLFRFFELKFSPSPQKRQTIMKWNMPSIITDFLVLLLTTDYFISNILSSRNFKIPGLSNYIICQKYVS